MKNSATTLPHIYCCIPIMEESNNILSLIQCLKNQTVIAPYTIICCVNQPDNWWNIATKRHICIDNQKTLETLHLLQMENVISLDYSTSGMPENQCGVGYARKIAMDHATSLSNNEQDIICAMDGDTFYPNNYLQSILTCFTDTPRIEGISAPYLHPLPKDNNPAISRSLLRYEIYMRYYALNMLRIGSPYHFTPLGSAISTTVSSYKKIGGMVTKQCGEDFYFLQKLRKSGEIASYIPATVQPQGRISTRVLFGTGPAIFSGIEEIKKRYPLYSPDSFSEISEIYHGFEQFFTSNTVSPALKSLHLVFKDLNWLSKLKNNSKSMNTFIKKCHIKFDGLKTIQFLKEKERETLPKFESETRLLENYLLSYHHNMIEDADIQLLNSLNFTQSDISHIDRIRNLMYHIELKMRKSC